MSPKDSTLAAFDEWTAHLRVVSDAALREEGLVLLGRHQAVRDLQDMGLEDERLQRMMLGLSGASLALADEVKRRELAQAQCQGESFH